MDLSRLRNERDAEPEHNIEAFFSQLAGSVLAGWLRLASISCLVRHEPFFHAELILQTRLRGEHHALRRSGHVSPGRAEYRLF